MYFIDFVLEKLLGYKLICKYIECKPVAALYDENLLFEANVLRGPLHLDEQRQDE